LRTSEKRKKKSGAPSENLILIPESPKIRCDKPSRAAFEGTSCDIARKAEERAMFETMAQSKAVRCV
jgi:hypothetical protein